MSEAPLTGRRAEPGRALAARSPRRASSTTARSAPARAPVLEAQAALRAQLEREPVRFFVARARGPARRGARRARRASSAPTPTIWPSSPTPPPASTPCCARSRSRPATSCSPPITPTTPAATRSTASRPRARRARGGRARAVPARGRRRRSSRRCWRAVTPRTRLALLDHVTSPTALVLPDRARWCAELAERGVDTLVDGAHAPGMVPLDLARARRGLLHRQLPQVAVRAQGRGVPPRAARPAGRACARSTISHGANAPRRDRSRFRLEFDWTGTVDPTACALRARRRSRFMGALVARRLAGADGAQPRAGAARARPALRGARRRTPPCPESMIGSLAAVPLPDGARGIAWRRPRSAAGPGSSSGRASRCR